MSEVATVVRSRSRELLKLRNRFYPGWWTHSANQLCEPLKPLYRVIVTTTADKLLAEESKPSNVRAVIQLAASEHHDMPRMPERLRAEIIGLFGDPAAWLDAPNSSLGGATPRAVLFEGRSELVAEVIERLKHGMVT